MTKIDDYIGGFLTLEQAINVFHQLADEPFIPFFATEFGCERRAFAMGDILLKNGITPRKIAVYAEKGKSLVVQNNPSKRHHSGWSSHIAIVLPVEVEGGAIVDLVFDPSLFDGPETVARWTKKSGGSNRFTKILDWDEPIKYMLGTVSEGKVFNMGDHEAARDLYKYFKGRQKYDRRAVSRSQVASQFFRDNRQLSRPSHGQTWTANIKHHPQKPLNR